MLSFSIPNTISIPLLLCLFVAFFPLLVPFLSSFTTRKFPYLGLIETTPSRPRPNEITGGQLMSQEVICQLRSYKFNWGHVRSAKITRGRLRSQKGCRGPMRMAKVKGGRLRSQEVIWDQLRSHEFNWGQMRSAKITRGRLRSQKGCWVPIWMVNVTWCFMRSNDIF